MSTTEALLKVIHDALKAKKIAKERYELCLNERIAAQRKAEEAHAVVTAAEADLRQALDALDGSIDTTTHNFTRRS